jgi:hypothetical protein
MLEQEPVVVQELGLGRFAVEVQVQVSGPEQLLGLGLVAVQVQVLAQALVLEQVAVQVPVDLHGLVLQDMKLESQNQTSPAQQRPSILEIIVTMPLYSQPMPRPI